VTQALQADNVEVRRGKPRGCLVKKLTAYLAAGALVASFGFVTQPAAADPEEPRYCEALIDAIAAAPDDSLFPMNTKKKKRLVNRAVRKQNRLYKKAYLKAKADGDRVAAAGLYWIPRDWVGNRRAFRAYTAGDAQAKRDCGIGFLG